ncbi:MAG: hypothetical protein ACKOFU_06130, partial [Actinomycetota bacterium]
TAVFIRAPWVEEVGESVQVLARVNDHAVAVRYRNLFATSFHPELTKDTRVHRYFIEEVVAPNLLRRATFGSKDQVHEGETR